MKVHVAVRFDVPIVALPADGEENRCKVGDVAVNSGSGSLEEQADSNMYRNKVYRMLDVCSFI